MCFCGVLLNGKRTVVGVIPLHVSLTKRVLLDVVIVSLLFVKCAFDCYLMSVIGTFWIVKQQIFLSKEWT